MIKSIPKSDEEKIKAEYEYRQYLEYRRTKAIALKQNLLFIIPFLAGLVGLIASFVYGYKMRCLIRPDWDSPGIYSYKQKSTIYGAICYITKMIGLLLISSSSLIASLYNKQLSENLRKFLLIFAGFVLLAIFQIFPFF